MAETAQPKFILASASARRRELLEQLGVSPDRIDPPVIDETPTPKELPRQYAARMAAEKLSAVAPGYPGDLVLAADTVVACGRRILPKTESPEAARRCLQLLSGRRHRVYGGICVRGPDGETVSRTVMTAVVFKSLSEGEVDSYIASDEWDGKAGGYAIQGRAAAFVRRLNGSYSNVVGLSLFEAAQLLQGQGLRL